MVRRGGRRSQASNGHAASAENSHAHAHAHGTAELAETHALRDARRPSILGGRSGALSVNEFFAWSLSQAAEKYGAVALEAAFSKYDTTHDGHLDGLEFENVCRDMGFSAVSHSIFETLDGDSSGSISYRELLVSVRQQVPVDANTKQLLSALVWAAHERDGDEREATMLDTSGWHLSATDAPGLFTQMRQLLAASGAAVSKRWVQDRIFF